MKSYAISRLLATQIWPPSDHEPQRLDHSRSHTTSGATLQQLHHLRGHTPGTTPPLPHSRSHTTSEATLQEPHHLRGHTTPEATLQEPHHPRGHTTSTTLQEPHHLRGHTTPEATLQEPHHPRGHTTSTTLQEPHHLRGHTSGATLQEPHYHRGHTPGATPPAHAMFKLMPAAPEPRRQKKGGIKGAILNIYYDPFKWSLVKSFLFFIAGVKTANDFVGFDPMSPNTP
ncbi:uncharacterized protein SPEM3 isoform X1 [Procambarus clarkii]|uniref:uncharacterized protein SPEM3 isoform X1 n=1 Tax=Procambarus clarkii TaxID=6728 RepID=UPI0037424261